MKILIVLPTYNEELVIEKNLRSLFALLPSLIPNDEWRVVIADNGSSDRTGQIVASLASTFPQLSLWTTPKKGRGNALREVWMHHDAEVYLYMDADLATDLQEIPHLLAATAEAQIVVGSPFGTTNCPQSLLLYCPS